MSEERELTYKEKRAGVGGRPLKYPTPELLQEAIDAYFDSCHEEMWVKDPEGNWKPITDKDGNIKTQLVTPYTVTGLALAIGLSRNDLVYYGNKDKFYDTVKKAKQKVEMFIETTLHTNKSATGSIFNLKNNYGWVDKQEVQQEVTGTVTNKLNLSGLSVDELRRLANKGE